MTSVNPGPDKLIDQAVAGNGQLLAILESLSLELDIDAMADKALQAATSVIGVQAGAVALQEPDGKHLRYRWYIGFDDQHMPLEAMQQPFNPRHGIAGLVMQSGKTQIVPDYPAFAEALQSYIQAGVRSALSAPIYNPAGQVVGMLSVAFLHKQCVFTPEHVRLVEMIARQIGVALHREQLLQDQKKYTRALKALSACNEVMMRASSEDELLQEVCNVIVEEEGYLGAWVGYKGNDAYQSLIPKTVAGVDRESLLLVEYTWNGNEPGVGSMPPGQAARTGQPAVVRDVFLEKECECCRFLAEEVGYQSVLALPIIIDHDVTGVLTIYAAGAYAFGDEEIVQLSNMVKDLAFGVQSLRTRLARRDAAIQLRESEQKFKAIFENARDGILVADAQTQRFYAGNRYICELLGYGCEELSKLTIADIHPPEALERAQATFSQSIKEGQDFIEDMPIICRDGAIRYVDISAASMQVDGRDYLIGSFRDITERKQVQQTLQKTELRYGLLFNSMLDGFAVHEMLYDDNGQPYDYRFLTANPAFEKITGLQADRIIGQTIRKTLPATEETWINTFAEVVKTGEAVRFQEYSAALGKHFEVVAFPAGDRRFATIFQDVTGRVQAEQSLVYSNRALRTISLCNEILVHATQEQQLLDEICEALVTQGDFRLAWVAYAEHDTQGTIRVAAKAGPAISALDHLDMHWRGPAADNGPTGRAIRSHQVLIERYTGGKYNAKSLRQLAAKYKLASFIALPLYSGDDILGALNIYSDKQDAFDNEEVRLLRELTDDLVFGIVSLRVRAEKENAMSALQRSEHNLHNIINHEADGVVVMDHDNTILFVNQALEKMLGKKAEQLLGSGFGFPLASDESSEIELINKDGALTHCEMRMTDGHWQNRPARIVTIHDISERIRLEQEREDHAQQQQLILVETITAMSNAMETRDPYTAGHMRRVSSLSVSIAERLGLEADRIEGIRLAGIIHDIGKLYVPAEILSRPGRLTPAEFEIIKSHAQVGYDIIKGVPFTWPVAQMVYQHHERLDGSGYPNGLKGDEIVLEARILAVADVVEAMSSHRPYRPSLGLIPAMEEIRKNRGVFYDAQVVDACIEVIESGLFEA